MTPGVSETLTWPTTSVPATSAFSTTGTDVAGRTRPAAPTRAPATSRAEPKSPVTLARPGDDQVAEGVALEVAGREAVLERPRPQRVLGGHGDQATPQVAGGGDAGDLAQPATRAAVVGDRHDRGDAAGVAPDRLEGRGQAVPAADGDHVGADGRRARRRRRDG